VRLFRRRYRREFRAEDGLLDWFYVRYRYLYLFAGLALLALLWTGFGALLKRVPPVDARGDGPGLTTARFTWAQGSVKVRRAGTVEWVAADRRTPLGRYDLVRTGPRSVAEIAFFDNTVIHLRPDSLVTIQDSLEDRATRQRRVAWHITSGEVNFQTLRKNVPESQTTVSTPTLRGDVDDLTRASMTVAGTGATDVRLFGGSARMITRAGETIHLASSEALRVDQSGKSQVKLPLPAAPVLLEPPHQAKLLSRSSAGSTVMLSWTAVPGATSYHVVMDDSAFFTGPFLDRRGLTENTVQIRGLDRGRYYWRVAAQASPELEGGFSDFARLTIAHPSQALELPPPPLFVEAVEMRTNILHVKGTTSPGASVTVNAARVDVRPDGSFNDFLTLEKPGSQQVVVRATGLEGGETVKRFNVTVVEP